MGNPTSLSCCLFLLISFLLYILTKHSCNGFDSLLKSNLSEISSWKLIFGKFRLSASSSRLIFCWESSLVLWNIISIFLNYRVLRKRWFEIRTIHKYISSIICLRSIKMVMFLNRFYLRMRVYWCWSYIAESFIKRFFHLFYRWLLLVVGKFSFLHCHIRFLLTSKCTIPSSRMILFTVSHLVLLSRRGSALWNPFPSRVVIP